MGFGALTRKLANEKKMNDEIAALKGGSQVFDRTGVLASQIAEKEAAIRAKYAPPPEPSPLRRGVPFNLGSRPSTPVTNQVTRILDNLGVRPNPVFAPAPAQSQAPIQNADMPAMTQPLQQPDITQNVPDIGLINRTMQREAPNRGLISGVFRRLRLAPPADIQRQNDIAQRLGGPQKQIDFDALKTKFRGMK